MADIKTKDVVKGTIKTIDKGAVAAERIKGHMCPLKIKQPMFEYTLYMVKVYKKTF